MRSRPYARGLLAAVALLLAVGVAEADGNARKRARARQKRAATREQDRREQHRIVARLGKDLKSLVQRCIDHGLLPLGWELVREIERKDPGVPALDELGAMLDRARGAPPDSEPGAEAEKEIRRGLEASVRRCATGLRVQANRLMRRGELELAYACYLNALRIAPDSAEVRKYVQGVFDPERNRWVPHCVTQGHERDGRVWDRRLGWVLKEHGDKYAAGLYPRIRKGKIDGWTKLEELDAQHRQVDLPWFLETEHFSILASTDLQNAVSVANWLEEFYAPWIATFSRVFGDKAKDLLFRSDKFPKLKVRMFHDEQMWSDWLATRPEGQIHEGDVGYFDPKTKESLFHVDHTLRETARHEVSHQLLDRAVGSKSFDLNTAMDEGLAVFIESARVESFALVGSGIAVLAMSGADREWLLGGDRPTLPQLLDFSYDEFHDAEHDLDHYMLAGLWTAFFFRYRDGLYSDDYIEFLQQDSWQQPSRAIAKRIGVEPPQLEVQFTEWVGRALEIAGREASGSVSGGHAEYLRRGREYLDSGKLEEAEAILGLARDYFEREVDLPGSLDDNRWRLAASYELLARVLRNSGRASLAKQSVRMAIPHRCRLPDYGGTTPKKLAACHFLLGLLHRESGWLVSARDALADCVRVLEELRAERADRPDAWFLLPAAHGRLASALAELGRTEEAETSFRKATQSYPGSPELNAAQAWFLLTCPEERHRDPERAVTLARAAVDADEESAWFRLVLGMALQRAGKSAPAVEELMRSMERSGQGCGLHWTGLALAHWDLGHKQDARKWLRFHGQQSEYAALCDWACKADLRRLRREAEERIR